MTAPSPAVKAIKKGLYICVSLNKTTLAGATVKVETKKIPAVKEPI